MSGDQPLSSFGDSTVQAPTPKQTPTTAVLPSPVLQTPDRARGSFEESSGWTPRFAEEYSVFNSTPGNLRGSTGSFPDFTASTPDKGSAGHKRPLSAENLAVEIASHVNHFSPDLSLPLPPVGPSQILSSSQGPASEVEEPSAKKARRGTVSAEQGQAATPPPSARKGDRKLAPRLQTDRMQNEQSFGHEFVATTPQQQQQQHNMPAFATTPTDMFGYPLSAPATAPVFTDSRIFWDADPSMTGMDMDFSATSANLFQASNHRPMNSIDWGRSNEMFQQETAALPQHQEMGGPPRRERALAPKPAATALDAGQQDTNMLGTSFTIPLEDPFVMMGQGDAVDPGLLFTRPPSSSMELTAFDPLAQAPLLQSLSQPEPLPLDAPPLKTAELRRSASLKDVRTKRPEKASASSPTKPSERPTLSRSFSENRGRKAVGRSSTLPTLAPARPPHQKLSRPSSSQMARASGRTSPLKNHHHRLSSLSSIPESMTPRPRTRTSVKFTIDARGRANAETTTVIVGDDEPSPTLRRPRTEPRAQRRSWGPPSDHEDDESSSSDDEPIIIPSRNASFALPDPQKPSSAHPFHSSQRSFSEQSASSLGIFYNEPNAAAHDAESDAETVMQDPENAQGDAASALRKMVQDRQRRETQSKNQRFTAGMYGASSTVSSATMTEGGLPTPSSSRGNAVRCTCNRTEMPSGSDGFMVQCESCEMWLHGKCTKITRRTLPRVYICAFCANTPNAHGINNKRDARRTMAEPSRGTATSPLAHKSFKSFR